MVEAPVEINDWSQAARGKPPHDGDEHPVAIQPIYAANVAQAAAMASFG